MVETVDAAETYALRHAVLGRGRTPGDVAAEDDDDPNSGHYATKIDASSSRLELSAAAPAPNTSAMDGRSEAWPSNRSDAARALGSAVLAEILDHFTGRGGGLVWCHVRIAARSLYERRGFVVDGHPFDDPAAGVQLIMSIDVQATQGLGSGTL